MNNNFDIIVIGAGSGGLNIAGFMNRAGFKVLLIDKSDKHIGGDCLNFGCVPSKALIHTARTVVGAKKAGQFGISSSGAADMRKIKEYIKAKQDIIRTHENAEYFRSIGMTVALGAAKFVSKNTVEVDDKQYSAKKIVIATGSRPRQMNIAGIENIPLYTNETIFDIDFLPKKLLVVGGGPIGIEIGQAFNYLGSKVTVLQKEGMILPKEEGDIANMLLERLKEEGIEFHFNSTVKSIGGNKLFAESNGENKHISFDAVFVAVGRKLNVEGLDLEAAGIEMSEGGEKIKVDDYLRTTNKRVYLCGDIAGKHQFTHAAELHAGLILRNFFSPFKKKLNTDNLSWVTYTNPEIATFGLGEDKLKERNIAYKTLESTFEEDDRAIVDDFRSGKVKLFISNGKLLGGSMIAPNAGELFQELILAQASGLAIKHIFNKIYPYPTASRINKKTISQHFSGKLTEFSKKLLHILFH